MTVIITVTVDAADGQREELVDRFNAILGDTREFDGCERITLSESQDSPGSFLLVEEWASMDHFAAYKTWRKQSGTTVLGTDLVVDPQQKSYNPVNM